MGRFLQVGSKVWLTRRNSIIPIVEGIVLESLSDVKRGLIYQVKYKTKYTYRAICNANELAYKENSDVIVPIGTRIVALFEERMFAGVVAEHPTHTNSNRYLIFFDDNNHAGYIEHKNIHVICDQSDAYENYSDFFRTYLENFPERPLVKFKKHQLTRTIYDNNWERTIVLDIDGSLVKMHFIDKDIIQWIYRGCERFELLSDLVDWDTEKPRKCRRLVPLTYQPFVLFTRDSETAVFYDSVSFGKSNDDKFVK
ncbi:histone-lysine N-methyltransferase SETDB1 [Caerostris extrusa]|uniref:Histone-lysine N-methyltransferase SETDB1 n=1 Tax=Caerostris extrusa TaxID=172846 RepID=A0AAV4SB94_CAEEX|nr:histone-lysine N-methyltransferase SETDB1 [Caerostris extrusa]